MRRLLLVLMLVLLAACGPDAPQTTPTGVVDEVDEIESQGDAIADSNQAAVEEGSRGASQPPDMVDTSGEIGGNPETFVAEDMGFAFNYPEGWQVTGEGSDPIILTSFEPEENGQGGIDPDQTKIDFVPEEGSVEERAAAQREAIEEGGGEIRQDVDFELPGGYSAVRIQYAMEDGQEQVVVITEVEDQPLLIAGYGNLLLFDQIINTLRPALEGEGTEEAGSATEEATEES